MLYLRVWSIMEVALRGELFMNKKLMIAIIIGFILITGGALFLLMSGDDDSSSSRNSENASDSSGDAETVAESENPVFDPLATTSESFTVELTTESSETPFSGTISYDGDGNYLFEGSFNNDDLNFYSVDDRFISCQNETCFELPDGENGVDNSTFEFDEATIDSYQDDAVYAGKADCPAGTCDKWTVSNEDVDLEMFVAEDGRISQASGTTDGSVFTAVFSYEPVTITAPENVQSFPL